MPLLPAGRDQRWLAVGNLVNMTGTGATLSALVVFLAEVRHLPLAQATALLTASGLIGVVGAVPLGQAGDRYGARGVAVVTELVCAASMVALTVAPGAWGCALCLAVRQLATSGNTAARATLMGRVVPPGERSALRAYQRAVTNVGFSLGALLSAAAMTAGGRAALYGLVLLDAATFCFGAYATSRLPGAGRGVRRPGLAGDALRDRGYVSVSLLNAVHTLNRSVVSLGIPLWVVYASGLPRWTVSGAMILNTCAVILLQVPLSGQARDIARSRRSLLWAGLLTAAGCAALAAAGTLRERPSLVWPLFVAACLVLAVGEILGAAAGWTLSYELAPDEFLGQYQGVWQLVADASAKAAGPALIGWALAAGPAGPAGLAGAFLLTGAVSPAVVGRAERRRRRPDRALPR
ncbi:MFS transporter [Streptomyces sp. NPDC038707]|uniref:MFS transporter n=1 Tax=unclassified Streptomyces TaxID=2593676 RepID=UPI003403E35C